MKGKEMLEALQTIPTFERGWETHQPEELREIEKLVIDVSKYIYHFKGRLDKTYVNEVCNDIKQLAHLYQRKVDKSR
jgi:hypothetical protein